MGSLPSYGFRIKADLLGESLAEQHLIAKSPERPLQSMTCRWNGEAMNDNNGSIADTSQINTLVPQAPFFSPQLTKSTTVRILSPWEKAKTPDH